MHVQSTSWISKHFYTIAQTLLHNRICAEVLRTSTMHAQQWPLLIMDLPASVQAPFRTTRMLTGRRFHTLNLDAYLRTRDPKNTGVSLSLSADSIGLLVCPRFQIMVSLTV